MFVVFLVSFPFYITILFHTIKTFLNLVLSQWGRSVGTQERFGIIFFLIAFYHFHLHWFKFLTGVPDTQTNLALAFTKEQRLGQGFTYIITLFNLNYAKTQALIVRLIPYSPLLTLPKPNICFCVWCWQWSIFPLCGNSAETWHLLSHRGVDRLSFSTFPLCGIYAKLWHLLTHTYFDSLNYSLTLNSF